MCTVERIGRLGLGMKLGLGSGSGLGVEVELEAGGWRLQVGARKSGFWESELPDWLAVKVLCGLLCFFATSVVCGVFGVLSLFVTRVSSSLPDRRSYFACSHFLCMGE